jgi:hypothetical protein
MLFEDLSLSKVYTKAVFEQGYLIFSIQELINADNIIR